MSRSSTPEFLRDSIEGGVVVYHCSLELMSELSNPLFKRVLTVCLTPLISETVLVSGEWRLDLACCSEIISELSKQLFEFSNMDSCLSHHAAFWCSASRRRSTINYSVDLIAALLFRQVVIPVLSPCPSLQFSKASFQ